MYEEQYGWVRWGSAKSDIFRISNGTRQGAVLSPAFWAIYCDLMIKELRQLGVGAHVAGIFMGAACYADDVVLIAPCHQAMQLMLDTVENFAMRFNISFSTDPDPKKSKSKCIYVVGNKRNLSKPPPLVLCGNELPWVESAAHLGHELHESGNTEHDAVFKRAQFIEKSVEVRTMFDWASPTEVLQALKTYCSSFYGSMLWDLGGVKASHVYSAWDLAVKLTWGCPRATRTFLLQKVLSCGMSSARTDIMSRYAKFFRGLRNSVSMEVRVLSNLVSRDLQSTTAKNLRLLNHESSQDPWEGSPLKIREGLMNSETVEVHQQDQWRIPYLLSLLKQYQEARYMVLDKEMDNLQGLIDSLAI